MVTVIRPSRARCVKGTIPRHERAVLTAGLPSRARRATCALYHGKSGPIVPAYGPPRKGVIEELALPASTSAPASRNERARTTTRDRARFARVVVVTFCSFLTSGVSRGGA